MIRILISSVSLLIAVTTQACDLAEKVDSALTERENEIAKRLPPISPKVQRLEARVEVLGGERYKYDGKELDTKELKKILQTLDTSKTTVIIKADNSLLHADLVKFFNILMEMEYEDVILEGISDE